MSTQFQDELKNFKSMLNKTHNIATKAIDKGDHEPCLDAINTILLINEVDYIVSALEKQVSSKNI